MPEQNIPEEELVNTLIGKAGEVVPVVDPEDLKNLWTYSQELRARHSNGGTATGIAVFQQMCCPGADVRAVWYRSSMLGVLAGMLESAWPGGELSETALKVASRMELNWMAVGVPQKGLPFDVVQFLAEVQAESVRGGARSDENS